MSAAAIGALAVMAASTALRSGSSPATSRQEVVLWIRRLPSPLDPGAPLLASQAAIAPDGSSIVYTDSTAQGLMLMRKPRDAAAAPLAGTEGGVSPFFSPDGRWVGYRTLDGRLRKVPVDGGGSVTLAEDGLQEYKAGAWLDDGALLHSLDHVWELESRDGAWLVFRTDNQGSDPNVWARSGRELLFRSAGQLMAVAVPPGPTFTPGPARALFSLAGYRLARNRQQYDVAPGDQRFLMIREPAATGGTMYVENWFRELRAKVKR